MAWENYQWMLDFVRAYAFAISDIDPNDSTLYLFDRHPLHDFLTPKFMEEYAEGHSIESLEGRVLGLKNFIGSLGEEDCLDLLDTYRPQEGLNQIAKHAASLALEDPD